MGTRRLSPGIKWGIAATAALLCLGVGVLLRGSPEAPRVIGSEGSRLAPTRSKAAAVTAAAAWLDSLDTRQELTDAPHLRRTIGERVAVAAQPEISARLEQAAEQLRSAAGGSAATLRSTPLGYRVVSYTERRAVIATWEVVARGSVDIAPSLLWARSQLTLVWQDGWKVAGTRVRLDGAAGVTAADLAALEHDYVSFRHAP